MGWGGCGWGPGTDLNGLGWYGRSGMGIGGLGCVRRAWDMCGGLRVDVKGQGGPDMGLEGFGWVWSA